MRVTFAFTAPYSLANVKAAPTPVEDNYKAAKPSGPRPIFKLRATGRTDAARNSRVGAGILQRSTSTK